MKKIVVLIFTIVAILCLNLTSYSAYLGDIDGNGKITASDARAILRISAKLDKLDDNKTVFADVNNDLKITASDARIVLRMSAKLDSLQELTTKATVAEITTILTTTKPITDSTTEILTTERATEAPTTEPVTEAPTTEPATETPTTEPVTEAPTTEPVTEAPTTEPTTEGTTKPMEPPSSLTAIEIHDIASKYTVEVNAENDKKTSVGSGFFISEDGKIVTNYHVIEKSKTISVTDYNGNAYTVTQVLAFDADMDIAVLKIDSDTHAALLDYETPITGAVVYTLGSSKGLIDTFTNGIISNASRVVEEYNPDMTYIQTTAPITNGNSGGPLINDKAQVIGINTWGRTDGQNLNFAIPVRYLNELDYSTPLTIEAFAELFESDVKLTASFASLNLRKGGAATLFVEVESEMESFSLIANYPKNYVTADIFEESFVNNKTGNKVFLIAVKAFDYCLNDNILVYVEEKPETVLTIPLTVTNSGWIDYGGDPGVIDYGAYLGVSPRYYDVSDDLTVFTYKYKFESITNAGISADYGVSGFLDYIETFGYEYVGSKQDEDYNMMYYKYSGDVNFIYEFGFQYDDYGDIEYVVIRYSYF